ncbi:MAG: hypothetical protein PHV99_00060 [Candidatus Pacebacteria bacterium]|nr:hypothetical protein [Candidatus Paceibacterota bacterium]
MKIGLAVIAVSMLLVVVEGLFSYFVSGNFTPTQVIARWGKSGISFIAHGGMWGDFFLLPALFAFIITRYGASWNTKMIVIMVSIGVLVTLANHLMLISTQVVPDPLGWKGEKWSTVIALHFIYMSTYVALAGLFYFSPGVSVKAAIMVSVMLGVHMAFGTHVPLGLLNRWYQWVWCPDFIASPQLPYLTTVIWATLTSFAWYAAGWRAGVSVASIGATLAVAVVFAVQVLPLPLVRTYD